MSAGGGDAAAGIAARAEAPRARLVEEARRAQGEAWALLRDATAAGRPELAEAVSRALPAPFLRIDFLRAADGRLVFCEFTPRPGRFSLIRPEFDRSFGAPFLRAEARLLADLLAGRHFPEWEAAAREAAAEGRA